MFLKKWLPGLLMPLLFLLLALLLQLLPVGLRPTDWLQHLCFTDPAASGKGVAQEAGPGNCRDPTAQGL